VVASVASLTAALVTSRLWIVGTPLAAAATPVLVALVSELLERPAMAVSGG
jgi:predicted outer membrane lipoprotein